MKEILLHAVVGDEYVCKSVVIVICECHSKRTALLGGDARFLANIRKRAIAIVVIKNVGRGQKLFRWTVRMPLAARHSGLRRHVGEGTIAIVVIENILSIARDVQIRISVIVVIADRNAHTVVPVSGLRQASLLGDIDKAS